MTDRVNGCVVVFEQDVRDDDVEPLLDAIRHLRGVLTVSTGVSVVDLKDFNARERVRRELSDKLWEVLHPKERTT